jgi:Ca2+-binding EF-hand superfamily protein
MSARPSWQPSDIMASGPQTLTLAAARAPRKGVHKGVCLAKLEPEEREQQELRAICEQIGFKAAQKFRTVREAFRYLDADHDGKITRDEMHYFFRAYNLQESIADRFFNRLDRDESGEVEYAEFMKFVAPYVQPDIVATCPSPECSSGASTRAPSPQGSICEQVVEGGKSIDPELQTLFEFIGRKATEKFSHAREAFRRVDCNNDGSISRGEMRYFFRTFNLSEAQADKFFEHMDHDGSGEIDYHEFVRFLGPFLDLPGTAATMLQRPEGHAWDRPSGRSSRHSRGSCKSQSSYNSNALSIIGADGLSECVGSMSQPQQLDPAKTEKEMRNVMKDIGEKLPLKFKHVRDAFRPLDLSHDGKITQTEMRSFLRGFGWPHEVADRLFNALDEDQCGTVDFNLFMSHFDAVLGPANRPARRGELIPETEMALKQEVNQVAAILREKLMTKFNSARHAFSTLDLSNDGQITQADMRLFFRSMCMPVDAATKVFKCLCKDGSETVRYDDFLTLFGPVDRPGGRWRTVQELE